MASVRIPDELIKHLEIIAEREGRSIEEIAESVLWQFRMAHWLPGKEQPPQEQETDTNDLFTLVMRAADELGESSVERNVSERSRELLNTELPDNLMRHTREQKQDNEKE